MVSRILLESDVVLYQLAQLKKKEPFGDLSLPKFDKALTSESTTME